MKTILKQRLHIDSGLETDYEEFSDYFPRFIKLESEGDPTLTSMSPFLIQKVIFMNIIPTNVKQLKKNDSTDGGRK